MKNQFVLPFKGRWAVRAEGTDEVTSIHDTIEEAIEEAKLLAKKQDSKLVVLREDGTIDNLGAYGINPLPDKDKTPEYNSDDEGV